MADQKKRRTLRLLGFGGAALLVVGAGGGWVVTRTPREATEPWRIAGEPHEDPRITILRWAVLAPSSHNLQPWIADLSEPGVVTVLPDTGLLLPRTDPFARQTVVSLGGFLEAIDLAAAANGFATETTLFPEGVYPMSLDDRPVARIALAENPEAEPDVLFDQLGARRTIKTAYDPGRPPPPETLEYLRRGAEASRVAFGAETSPDAVAPLREIVREAGIRELMTPRVQAETVAVMRIGKAEINANPDGIALQGPAIEAMAAAGMVTRSAMMDPESTAFRQGVTMYEEQAAGTPAFVWLATERNDRESQVAAGRSWLRMQLEATARGLALHPMSQALQEYQEVSEFYDAVHTRLGLGGRLGTIQMLARAGYADPPGHPQPRWAAADKLVGGAGTAAQRPNLRVPESAFRA
ncbi:twin-arginine translocation pathway signal protein [Marinicauda salina]|uniref:Twin-arginine translocation pathway signal protein n=1 Tax=Marinicauda salina TaxID=2135793 RepID=A0A2U2BQR3_9PROT|nr:twin-arginine translocation pathway signal protein [Marinicauda salina]PWE16350.1 twin-arginine translocation pathway signal protein [Marinicauda salina]